MSYHITCFTPSHVTGCAVSLPAVSGLCRVEQSGVLAEPCANWGITVVAVLCFQHMCSEIFCVWHDGKNQYSEHEAIFGNKLSLRQLNLRYV